MNVLVLGIDGYLGWSVAMHLAERGHTVTGVDNFSRRKNVERLGSVSAIPIKEMKERISIFAQIYDKNINFFEADLLDYNFLKYVVASTFPDCIEG